MDVAIVFLSRGWRVCLKRLLELFVAFPAVHFDLCVFAEMGKGKTDEMIS